MNFKATIKLKGIAIVEKSQARGWKMRTFLKMCFQILSAGAEKKTYSRRNLPRAIYFAFLSFKMMPYFCWAYSSLMNWSISSSVIRLVSLDSMMRSRFWPRELGDYNLWAPWISPSWPAVDCIVYLWRCVSVWDFFIWIFDYLNYNKDLKAFK